MRVPCSMTSAEPGSRPVLPSAFPDSVGLDIVYAARSHGPHTHCLRFALGSPLPAQDSLPAVLFLAFGRVRLITHGDSIRGFSSLTFPSAGVGLAHQGIGKPWQPIRPQGASANTLNHGALGIAYRHMPLSKHRISRARARRGGRRCRVSRCRRAPTTKLATIRRCTWRRSRTNPVAFSR